MVFERTGEKKTYLQKLQGPGFCLPAPGSFSQPAQALVEDCQVLVGLLHSATEKKVKDGSKAGKKSPKGQKKGKIGDERPSIKWSERSIFSNLAKRD